MADEPTVIEGVVDAGTDAPVVDAAAAPAEKGARPDFRSPRGRRPGGREGRPPRRGAERPRSEFDQKIITIRRVARVMAGGRRFNFSVAVVIGNKKGKVGVGLGKAGDTTLAIDKAVRDAKKHLHTLVKIGRAHV